MRKLWIICGYCGSDDVAISVERDGHDWGDGSFTDAVNFSCKNCGKLLDDEEVKENLQEKGIGVSWVKDKK